MAGYKTGQVTDVRINRGSWQALNMYKAPSLWYSLGTAPASGTPGFIISYGDLLLFEFLLCYFLPKKVHYFKCVIRRKKYRVEK